jgi:glycosyltransferase involved in cell wall biosynthesis
VSAGRPAAAPAPAAGTDAGEAPEVSVIVPTRNRAPLLAASIAGVLRGCAGVAAEVIYVDDGSTDGTRQVLAAHAGRIRWVEADCGAPGCARNAGAAVARGRYLLFTDDDCVIPPGWAAAMLALRRRHGCEALSCGFSPARMETAAERYYEYRMRTLFGDRAKPVAAAPMMGFLVDRAAFARVGGFSELRLTSMEDWELCYRLTRAGCRLMYDPAVRVGHAYGREWRYVLRRVVDAAWLGPLVWRQAGVGVVGKLARDGARFVAAPLWCWRYFPPDLYLQAVALEILYFAVRLAAVAARLVGAGPAPRPARPLS